jgi:hypothetical protein
MMKKIKAQVSVEAVALTSFLVFFLVLGMTFFMMQMSSTVDGRDNELLVQIGNQITSEMQMARSAEAGYEREFYIPNSVDNKEVKIIFPRDDVAVVSTSGPAEAQLELIRGDNTKLTRGLLLGNDVEGALFNGDNVIKKTEDGIMVVPENITGLLNSRPVTSQINPQVAYAKIVKENNPLSPLTVNSSIACEYGIVNANPSYTLRVNVRYRFYTSSSPITTNYVIMDLVANSNVSIDDINGVHTSPFLLINSSSTARKGYNISCEVSLGAGGATSSKESKQMLITDIPPYISITYVSGGSSGIETEEGMSWEFTAIVNYGDLDVDDNQFDVTFIAEGTNAGYLKCTENCNEKNKDEGFHNIRFKYVVPFEQYDCNAISSFGFKVSVANADNPEGINAANHVQQVYCNPDDQYGETLN